MSRKSHNPLILLEASTGIEPVYTDLQSAASPLRQLAVPGDCRRIYHGIRTRKMLSRLHQPLPPHSFCGMNRQHVSISEFRP